MSTFSFLSTESITIEECAFIGNEAGIGGGVCLIDWRRSTDSIDNLLFINNSATYWGGGLFHEEAMSTFEYHNLYFINNTAENGGGLASGGTLGDMSTYDSIFINNTATEKGGAYYDGSIGTQYHNFYNTVFVGNTVKKGYGGAIYASLAVDIEDSTFINNSASDPEYGGGAIALVSEENYGDSTIKNSEFEGNYGVHGSSILFEGYSSETSSSSHHDIIEGCTFTNDIGVYGIIETYNSIEITKCTFSNNDETPQDSKYGTTFGSALVLDGTNYDNDHEGDFTYEATVTITSSSFENLKADKGGAIYAGLESGTHVDGIIYIDDCIFRDCSAYQGGAIYLENIEAHITLSKFFNNTAEDLGGAIYITGEYDNIEIIENHFEDNTALYDNTIYTTFDNLLTITGNEIVRTDLTAQIYDTKRIYSPIDDQLDVERADDELVKVTFIITDPDKNLRGEISAEYDHDIGFVYIDYEFDTLGVWTVNVEYADSNNNIITLNVDVTPIETELTIKEITVESKDEVTITGTLTANSELLSSQEVYLYINDVLVDQTTTVNGEYTFTTDQSVFGYNKVEVRFEATGNYAESSATDHYTISDTSTRTDSKVTVSSIDDITIGDSVTITGTLKDSNGNAISSGTVNVIVNGATRTATVKDGVYSVSGYKPSNTGTYIVTVVYIGNDVYNPSTASTKFNVDKLTTSVTVEKISDIKINESVIITGVLEDNNGVLANKEVIITINDEIITTTTDENGRYYLNYTPSKTGSYSVLVDYPETANSTESHVATALNTAKLETTITVANITAKEGETINLTAYIVDENNNPVSEGKAAFKLNDVTLKDENGDVIYVDVIDGVAKLEYTINNTAKNYTITGLYYGSNNYYTDKSEHGILEVQKANMTTTVLLNDITAQYMDTIEFVAKVIDEKGNIVTTGKIVFKLNGVSLKDENGDVIYIDVDENGYARLKYTITNNPKIYNITAVYSGDEYYLTSRNETAILNVTNRLVNITVDSASGKSGDTVQFKATIKEDIPEIADEGSVIFKLNGVTLKDNDGNAIKAEVVNGVATLDYEIPVDMAGKDYNITAVYSNKNYERAEANNTLTVERSAVTTSLTPLTTTEGTDATITAVLYDENGNQLERSTKVAIKINGKTVVHTTTENGVLNVKIPTEELSKGDYTINVVFGENSAYTELRLNTTLKIV